jgi:hypothetical protein
MSLVTPAPAEDSPLAQVPAGAPIVLQIHGVKRTKERLRTMVKNALPELASQAEAKIEEKLNDELKGRKLQGLAPAGPDFVVVTALPELTEKASPQVAYLARVTDYAEFRDGLLKPHERKTLASGAHGYEVATLESGEKLYLLHRHDYAIFTSDKEVADQFAKGQPALRLDRQLTSELLKPDMALYVDVAAINAKYRDKIKSCRQLVEQWFGPNSPAMKSQTKSYMEFLQTMIGTAFQAEADTRAVVAGVEFRPEGLAVSGHAEVKANTQTDRYLKSLTVTSSSDLAALPAGQLGYWTMVLSPEVLRSSMGLQSILLGTNCQTKLMQEAVDELVAARPRSLLGTFSYPVSGLRIAHYQDPAKADAGMLRLVEAFEAGGTIQSVPIEGKPVLKPHARSYRGFQLSYASIKWDFDRFVAKYEPPEQREQFKAAMQHLMGTGIQIWFGTNRQINVQVAAQDWPSAQRQLDRYLDGKDTLGEQAAYQEARKDLPSEASLIGLLNVPQYIHDMEPFLHLKRKEHRNGAAAASPAHTPANEKPAYCGMAVQLQAERIGFQLWLPGAAAHQIHQAYAALAAAKSAR